ncbi:MAG TPA: MogA/MoaB family molybdenum cofactor biosynthesis protein [Candidatus Luteococcus avicola]|nr:MogA/MoaB family molybdenum cofactor biosynthesis protein [Candidatus Luteococcus avicola]
MSVESTTAHLVVVSDRAATDPSENRAAPILEQALGELGTRVGTSIVANEPDEVRQALAAAVRTADVVITIGGTGIRPGDCVVDLTAELEPLELPGLAEEIRRRGAQRTAASLLSRGLCGLVADGQRRVLVVNSPSSRGGAQDVADVLGAVLEHLVRDLGGHERV